MPDVAPRIAAIHAPGANFPHAACCESSALVEIPDAASRVGVPGRVGDDFGEFLRSGWDVMGMGN